MKRKSLKPKARGPKPIEMNDKVEMEVYGYIEDSWEKERRITRATIFRKAIDMDPKFLGGVRLAGNMTPLKKWFYHCFKNIFNPIKP